MKDLCYFTRIPSVCCSWRSRRQLHFVRNISDNPKRRHSSPSISYYMKQCPASRQNEAGGSGLMFYYDSMETPAKVEVSRWLSSDYPIPRKCQTKRLRKSS